MPFGRYWPSVAWVVLGSFVTHLNSVLLPLNNQYRENKYRNDLRSGAYQDWESFRLVMSDTRLRLKLNQHSVQAFCVELTRFIDEYQNLKVAAVEAFKDHEAVDGIPPVPPAMVRPYNRAESSTKESAIKSATLSATQSLLAKIRLPSPAPKYPIDITPPTTSIVMSVPSLNQRIFPITDDALSVPEQLKPSFLNFYTTFIKTDSFLEVNLTADVRTRIMDQMKSGAYTLTMFDEANKQVHDLLFYNVFPSFVMTNMTRRQYWSIPVSAKTVSELELRQFY
ncbi:hypothetical protein BC938DRAFT_482752 [Jimgerdemannia flammicorona]|uniref:RGS domain-containing protein n=1 Tax=Jimgerdemannia flammicorona TaxID=994334 RepID=A0A433QDC7_9FUNG|nr:hypothetical protein BC938DRAFT_482752 [Jimgerdemannia flammicorona]